MSTHDKSNGALASDAPTTRTVFRMRPACGGQWLLCIHSIEVAAMLDEADEGSTFEVEVVEMTEAQIENTGSSMAGSSDALSTPRAVSCPYCQARPGDPCTLLDGTEMTGRHGGHHLTRVFNSSCCAGPPMADLSKAEAMLASATRLLGAIAKALGNTNGDPEVSLEMVRDLRSRLDRLATQADRVVRAWDDDPTSLVTENAVRELGIRTPTLRVGTAQEGK